MVNFGSYYNSLRGGDRHNQGSPVGGQSGNQSFGQWHPPTVIGGGSVNPHMPSPNYVIADYGDHAPYAWNFAGLNLPFFNNIAGFGGMGGGSNTGGYFQNFGGGPTPKPAQSPPWSTIAPEPYIQPTR
jgi:hypothetical protein